jgi:hypothetical protein
MEKWRTADAEYHFSDEIVISFRVVNRKSPYVHACVCNSPPSCQDWNVVNNDPVSDCVLVGSLFYSTLSVSRLYSIDYRIISE